MIRTESGGRIPASYRSGRYEAWKERNHQAEEAEVGEDDDDGPQQSKLNKPGKKNDYFCFHAISPYVSTTYI